MGHGSHILTVQSEYISKEFGPLVSGSKREECEFMSSLPQPVKAGQNEEVCFLLQDSHWPPHPGHAGWPVALLPYQSLEICSNLVEMFTASRYQEESVKKGMRTDFPRESFPLSTVLQSRAREREICGILGNKCGNLQAD